MCVSRRDASVGHGVGRRVESERVHAGDTVKVSRGIRVAAV